MYAVIGIEQPDDLGSWISELQSFVQSPGFISLEQIIMIESDIGFPEFSDVFLHRSPYGFIPGVVFYDDELVIYII